MNESVCLFSKALRLWLIHILFLSTTKQLIMYNLKHFLDNLGICAFDEGLFNLATIVLAVIMFVVSKSAVADAKRLHHKGQRFLW